MYNSLFLDFQQSGNERYNLYKYFHFSIRSDPFVRRAIYLIAYISRIPLTDGFREEEASISQFQFKHGSHSMFEKRKRRNLCLKKCLEKGPKTESLSKEMH